MNQIYHLDSDSSLLDELSNWIRNRCIDQKFIYQGTWAELYYLDKSNDSAYTEDTLEKEDFLNFLKQEHILWTKKTAIISLWCGNSWNEEYIFKNLEKKNIDYFWVDSSPDMLNLSINNLKNIDINKSFICADFSSKNFRLELEQLTKGYENRIFVFFSNTFWNIKHTNIIDILWNLLKKWEKIWLDIRLRKWKTVENDFDISNMVANDLKRKEVSESFLNILKQYWVMDSSGSIRLKITKEETIGALNFTYSFLFKEKLVISIKWEKIFILAWENITLQQMYIYDAEWLIDFFHEHWFKKIDKQIKWYRWQFLFEKNWKNK